MNPGRQEVHVPVVSSHWLHPSPHTLQSPVDERKNPEAHFPQATPSAPVSNPVVHSHCPFAPHTPFTQLQVDGLFGIVGFRQRPVPDIPWSQVSQLEGQGWHFGPKNPGWHCSQDAPANPAAHRHFPATVQRPALLQAGEQATDSRLLSERAPATLAGSWLISGTGSQRVIRLLEPAVMVATRLFEMARALALRGTEALTTGASGRPVKAAWLE